MRAPCSLRVGSHSPGIKETLEMLTWEPGGERTLSAGLQTGTSSLVLALRSVTRGSASKQLPLLSKCSSRKLSSERSWQPKEAERPPWAAPKVRLSMPLLANSHSRLSTIARGRRVTCWTETARTLRGPWQGVPHARCVAVEMGRGRRET